MNEYSYSLEPFSPFATPAFGALDSGNSGSNELVMLDIEFKYQFVDDSGKLVKIITENG